jgi:hypothetical protein
MEITAIIMKTQSRSGESKISSIFVVGRGINSLLYKNHHVTKHYSLGLGQTL